MSTEFKLYNISDEDLYGNKTPEEKTKIRMEMVVMAKESGIVAFRFCLHLIYSYVFKISKLYYNVTMNNKLNIIY